jgi:hypothetical protein
MFNKRRTNGQAINGSLRRHNAAFWKAEGRHGNPRMRWLMVLKRGSVRRAAATRVGAAYRGSVQMFTQHPGSR